MRFICICMQRLLSFVNKRQLVLREGQLMKLFSSMKQKIKRSFSPPTHKLLPLNTPYKTDKAIEKHNTFLPDLIHKVILYLGFFANKWFYNNWNSWVWESCPAFKKRWRPSRSDVTRARKCKAGFQRHSNQGSKFFIVLDRWTNWAMIAAFQLLQYLHYHITARIYAPFTYIVNTWYKDMFEC